MALGWWPAQTPACPGLPLTLRRPLCQSHAEPGTHPSGKTLGIPSPGKAGKTARFRQAEEGEAGQAEAQVREGPAAGQGRAGRRQRLDSGRGVEPGRSRRGCWEAPRREHAQFAGSSPPRRCQLEKEKRHRRG